MEGDMSNVEREKLSQEHQRKLQFCKALNLDFHKAGQDYYPYLAKSYPEEVRNIVACADQDAKHCRANAHCKWTEKLYDSNGLLVPQCLYKNWLSTRGTRDVLTSDGYKTLSDEKRFSVYSTKPRPVVTRPRR